MRYAAKRTWPDRPKAWEQQGEGETLEAFALTFATDRGLGVGTEFVVLDKDSDDATLESFRVTGADPYTLGPTGPRPEGQAAASSPHGPWSPEALAAAAANTEPPPAFSGAAMSFMFYMIKVAVIAVGVLGTLFYLIKHFGLAPTD
jgi:hypothetical protein